MGKDSVWTMPHQLLSDYWQQTGIRRLTGAKCREFLGAEGLVVTSCRILALRAIYRSVLNEYGLEYEGQYYSWLQKFTILWVAIIWQAEKLGLVSGPNDGLYTLEEDGLNWSGVSDIAQDIAPVHLRDMYSREGCLNQPHRLGCTLNNYRLANTDHSDISRHSAKVNDLALSSTSSNGSSFSGLAVVTDMLNRPQSPSRHTAAGRGWS